MHRWGVWQPVEPCSGEDEPLKGVHGTWNGSALNWIAGCVFSTECGNLLSNGNGNSEDCAQRDVDHRYKVWKDFASPGH
jgi:hypothetical protein